MVFASTNHVLTRENKEVNMTVATKISMAEINEIIENLKIGDKVTIVIKKGNSFPRIPCVTVIGHNDSRVILTDECILVKEKDHWACGSGKKALDPCEIIFIEKL